jgi:hypothetical protein
MSHPNSTNLEIAQSEGASKKMSHKVEEVKSEAKVYTPIPNL